MMATEQTTAEWMAETCRAIEDAGEVGGWDGEWTKESGRNWKSATTGSRYCELSRCLNKDTGDEEWQTVTIRVADHATAYCREDFSVVKDGGNGDDHKLATVLAWLRSE